MPTKTEINLARLIDLIAVLEPELDSVAIDGAVQAAAPDAAILGKLTRSLSANPKQLLTSKVAAIPAHTRLALELRSRGARHVAVPECAICNRPVVLEYRRGNRRICRSCFNVSNVAECAKCHRTKPISVRKDGLPLCAACRAADVAFHEKCSKCGILAVPAARKDGQSLCQLCYDRPKAPCSNCGNVEPVHIRRPQVLCKRCYGLARSNRTLAIRPAQKHREFRRVQCSCCGKHRLCKDFDSEEPLCAECAGRPLRNCVSCRRNRPAQAIWEVGPVCNTCYDGKTGSCLQCHETRPVILIDGEPLCHKCAGRPGSSNCTLCNAVASLYERGRCARCVLDGKLSALLPDSERVNFTALRNLLLAHSEPETILGWLRKSSKGVGLLTDLAHGRIELSHQAIDNLGPDKAYGFVRSLLVTAEILPERSSSFSRLLLWLESFLARNPDDRTFLEMFAQWHVFRRLRIKADCGRFTEAGNAWARSRIRAAGAFLKYLRSRNILLSDCTQGDVEDWLSCNTTTAYTVRDFVRWAVRRKFAKDLDVPVRKVVTPSKPIESDERWALIRKLISGEIQETDLRIAGALNLLFGQQSSRIVALTDRDVVVDNGDVCVVLGSESVPLPPPFGALIQELVATRRSQPRARSRSGLVYLFPGKFYGRPCDVGRFTERLNKIGIYARAGRNATLMELAAKLPAPILSSLLGLHINTSVEWNRAAGHSYTTYVRRLKRQFDGAAKPRRRISV
jgi:hypothetical protein